MSLRVDMQPAPFLLGITGGIGSGKSTVAALLKTHFKVDSIDADAISRDLTASDGAAIGPIAARFGPDFIDATGAMDRHRMRDHVFEHIAARDALEAIIHPLISQTIASCLKGELRSAEVVILELPLLVESAHWRARLDGVLVIDCPTEVQIERVQRRSQLPRETIERILKAQASRSVRLRAADYVIHNGDIAQSVLAQQVLHTARLLRLTPRIA